MSKNSRVGRRVLAAAFAIMTAMKLTADAQSHVEADRVQRDELSVETLITMPRLPANPQVSPSPDGKLVAYIVEITQASDTASDAVKSPQDGSSERRSELWMSDLDTGQVTTICCEKGNATFPSWSEDERQLAFYRRGSSATNVLVTWNRNTHQLREYGQPVIPEPIFPPYWLPGNVSILLLTQPASQANADQVRQGIDNQSKTAVHDTTIHVSTTSAFRGGATPTQPATDEPMDSAYIKGRLRDVVMFDVMTGESRVLATSVVAGAIAMSSNCKFLFYSSPTVRKANSFFIASDIYSLDLSASGKNRVLLRGVTNYAGQIQLSPSPHGSSVAFVDVVRRDARKNEETADLVVVDADGGAPIRIEGQFADRLARDAGERPIWSKDGKWISLYRADNIETWDVRGRKLVSRVGLESKHLWDVVATRDDHTADDAGPEYSITFSVQDLTSWREGFWRLWPLSGKLEALTEFDATAGDSYLELLRDGTHMLFVRQSAERPPEIFESDADSRTLRQITRLASSLDGVALGQIDVIKWLDEDGIEQKGDLLLPAKYERRKKYPLIVIAFAGEYTPVSALHRFGMIFGGINLQLLANRGYAVLLTGPRVSPDTKMADIAKQTLPGIQAVIASGVADAERIGVMGGSDAGYATFALITQSRIFKAAVALSAYTNIISMESGDRGRRVIRETHKFTATAWKNRDIAIENSPYFYMDRISAPVLILHGSSDDAVPKAMAEEAFSALEDLGKKGVYVEYEGESHIPAEFTVSHQIDFADRIIAWFDKYLKPTQPPRN